MDQQVEILKAIKKSKGAFLRSFEDENAPAKGTRKEWYKWATYNSQVLAICALFVPESLKKIIALTSGLMVVDPSNAPTKEVMESLVDVFIELIESRVYGKGEEKHEVNTEEKKPVTSNEASVFDAMHKACTTEDARKHLEASASVSSAEEPAEPVHSFSDDEKRYYAQQAARRLWRDLSGQ